MNNYELLIRKLDGFIRKFYSNHLLRGSLIFLACALGIALLLSLGEYFLYFPSWLKIILLFLLSLAGLAALIAWILIPLLQMQRLGKIISHEQAAIIIGKHFPDIEDKLLNVLQLKHNLDPAQSRELVEASIKQKSDEIILVPFLKAVNISENKKYLRYILPTVFIIGVILVVAPNLFKDAAVRLLQPGTDFTPPAPFSFFIINKNLKVPVHSSFTLNVTTRGAKIPDQVSLVIDGRQLNMEKQGPGKFSYTFYKVSHALPFYLSAAGVNSSGYLLDVMEKPVLEGFSIQLAYPLYTGMNSKELHSLMDVVVPEGTQILWKIKARFTEQVSQRFDGASSEVFFDKVSGQPEWNRRITASHDSIYKIYLSNREIKHSDSFQYRIQVIPDQVPRVVAQQFKDSVTGQQILLSGQASDDYGLSRLFFRYYITDKEQKILADMKKPIQMKDGKILDFHYYFDVATLDLKPGNNLHYYIEAWDNDGIHGSKRGISEIFNYHQADKKEMDSLMQENAEQMRRSLSNSSSQAKSLNKQVEKVQNQILNNKSVDWEQQQNLQSLAGKQEQVRDQLEHLKKRFEEQKKQSVQQQHSRDILEKQDAIEKQMDQLLNKELAEQLQKLRELLTEKNKEQIFQKLQEWEQQNKLFNMDMERIKELMNKLDMQMKLEDLARKLDALAKDQQSLEQKTAQHKTDNQTLAKGQQELTKKLDELMKKDFTGIEKANQQQENPQSLSSQKESGDAAKDKMQNSEGLLRQNQSRSAQESQKSAAEHLQNMAASMMQMAGGMDMQQLDIDIRSVRQLLTNLIRYSFDQEALMERERSIPVTSPLFKNNAQQQNRLKDNARMIRDSLFSLSKRVFQLAPVINKESTEWTDNINRSLAFLEDRRVHDARVRQQYAMSNANNLALMLNETLENMLQMQAQGQKGSGQSGKPKPGQGGAGQMMKDIITGQQALGKGMKAAQGKEEGGKQPGNQSGSRSQQAGAEQAAEQLARLAQEQADLRRQIQALSSLLNSKGFGGQNARLLQEIQEAMNQNETDLVNRRLGTQLSVRQQQIMSRMLEAEKAIREQEEDNKRSANSGKDMSRPLPPELRAYLKDRQSFLESYKTVPADLSPFYKKMMEDYWKAIQR